MITSASFIITECCNLACTYCFENEWRKCGRTMRAMTRKTISHGLEWLFENAKEAGTDHVDIMLFGGEPLLRPDLCGHLLQTGYELQTENNIQFRPNLITNGTLWNWDIEHLLYKYKLLLPGYSAQLSIDGVGPVHDMNRVYPDGHGSYADIEENIGRYLKIFKGSLCVHGVVSRETMPHLFESYKAFADMGVPNIWFMPLHTEVWTEADVALYDAQMQLIYDDMISRNTVSIYAPINKCLSGDRKLGPKTCGAGNSFFTITPAGDLWPCHNVYFNDPEGKQKCGNIWDRELDEAVLKPYREYDINTMGCGDCENSMCYRCIADNLVHNGDLNAQVGKPMRCLLSGVERKYQKMAKEYADSHFVPQNLTEARVRQKLVEDVGEIKAALSLLMQKFFLEDLPELGMPNFNPEGPCTCNAYENKEVADVYNDRDESIPGAAAN